MKLSLKGIRNAAIIVLAVLGAMTGEFWLFLGLILGVIILELVTE